jgi:protein TonB
LGVVLLGLSLRGGPAVADDIPAKPLAGNRPPDCPDAARKARTEGTVSFRAKVDAAGHVESVEIEHVPAPKLGFEEKVEQAVLAWKFDPATAAGVAVPSVYEGQVDVPVTFPSAHARMYTKPSEEVWAALQRVLHDRKIDLEKKLDADGVAVSKPEKFDAHRDQGLSKPPIAAGWAADRFELHAFVPPSFHPARVYVDTVVKAQNYRMKRDANFYGDDVVSAWIFDGLERELGEKGVEIPVEKKKRDALVQMLVDPGPCPCGYREAAGSPVESQAPVPVWKVKATYPGVDVQNQNTGKVHLQAFVQEDGLVRDITPIGGPSDELISASAQAAYLWRFRPSRAKGCPEEVLTTFEMEFQVTRFRIPG